MQSHTFKPVAVMTHIKLPRFSALSGIGGLAMLMLALLVEVPVRAAEWRSSQTAELAGQALIEEVARGELDRAFEQAAALGRPDDSGLRERLQAHQREVAATVSDLGAVRSVSTPEETFFAGCVTRSYLVRHDEGHQRWLLKFRRGVEGWHLSELNVRVF